MPKHAGEAGPPDPARKSERTHKRTGPGRGPFRPARGGDGVCMKQPRCTIRVPVERQTIRETGRVSDRLPTNANHRSARSPRPMPQRPAGDHPDAGSRTGTMRTKPSAPASAGASGRHKEPGSRPASTCPAQPPSKSGGKSPGGAERHRGVRKTDRSTESDRTGRGAAHAREARRCPQPRHTGRCQATKATRWRTPWRRAQHATNHVTGAGARQQPTHTPQTRARIDGVQAVAHTDTHTPEHPRQQWRDAGET